MAWYYGVISNEYLLSGLIIITHGGGQRSGGSIRHSIATPEASRSEKALGASPRIVLLLMAGRVSCSMALAHELDDCFGNAAAYVVRAM